MKKLILSLFLLIAIIAPTLAMEDPTDSKYSAYQTYKGTVIEDTVQVALDLIFF